MIIMEIFNIVTEIIKIWLLYIIVRNQYYGDGRDD